MDPASEHQSHGYPTVSALVTQQMPLHAQKPISLDQDLVQEFHWYKTYEDHIFPTWSCMTFQAFTPFSSGHLHPWFVSAHLRPFILCLVGMLFTASQQGTT